MLNEVATQGRVRILRATMYKSHMIYIRQIGKDYFEYLLEFKGEIYSGYNIFTPREGKRKIGEEDISTLGDLCLAMAQTTLDALLGETPNDTTKRIAEEFEAQREAVEGKDQDA